MEHDEEQLIQNENFSGCNHCHYRGLLKVITINHNGKIYLLHVEEIKRQKGFLKKYRETLQFNIEFMPCVCDKGTALNTKGGIEWISENSRYTIFQR